METGCGDAVHETWSLIAPPALSRAEVEDGLGDASLVPASAAAAIQEAESHFETEATVIPLPCVW